MLCMLLRCNDLRHSRYNCSSSSLFWHSHCSVSTPIAYRAILGGHIPRRRRVSLTRESRLYIQSCEGDSGAGPEEAGSLFLRALRKRPTDVDGALLHGHVRRRPVGRRTRRGQESSLVQAELLPLSSVLGHLVSTCDKCIKSSASAERCGV